MGDAGTSVCPHCGSTDTNRFDDGSGMCNACGRAIRGGAPVGVRVQGEAVRAAPVRREKIKLGLLGLIGGLLGFVAIPTVFLLGAALRNPPIPVSEYVTITLNRPEGAVACGGVSLLVIAAWYATWAGFLVWRGYPERTNHLLIAGILLTVAAALAGLGLPGIVGIVGGILGLVAGLAVWWRTREKEAEEESPPSAPESS